MAAKDSADDCALADRDVAEVRISDQVGRDGCPVVAIGDFHSFGLVPKLHDRVVVLGLE